MSIFSINILYYYILNIQKKNEVAISYSNHLITNIFIKILKNYYYYYYISIKWKEKKKKNLNIVCHKQLFFLLNSGNKSNHRFFEDGFENNRNKNNHM